MAVGEVRERLRQKLEQDYGVEEAQLLMDRPPGGWADLVTKEFLELKLDALEQRLIARVERQLKVQTWVLASSLITGLGVFGGILRV